MDNMDTWLVVICAVVAITTAIVILFAVWKSGRPIRTIGGSAIQGMCALAAVNVAGAFTGTSLGLGAFSVICCVIGGIPGVIALLLIKLIMGI